MKNVKHYMLMGAAFTMMSVSLLKNNHAFGASYSYNPGTDESVAGKSHTFFQNAATFLTRAAIFSNNPPFDDVDLSPEQQEAALIFKNYLNHGDMSLLRSAALKNEAVAWLYLHELSQKLVPQVSIINDDEVTYAFANDDDARTIQELGTQKLFSSLVNDLESHLALQAYRLSNNTEICQERGISPQGVNFLREKTLHDLREMAKKGSKGASERYSSVILEEIEQAKIALFQGKRLLDLSPEKIGQLEEAEFSVTGQREQINAIKAQRDVLQIIQEELNKNIHIVVAEAPEIKEFQRYLLNFFSNSSQPERGADNDLKNKVLKALAQTYDCSVEDVFSVIEKQYDPELVSVIRFFQQLNDSSVPMEERLSKILSDLPDEKSLQVAIYKNIVALLFSRSHDAELGFSDQAQDPSKAEERLETMMMYLTKVKQLDNSEGKRLFTYYFSRIAEALITQHDLIEAVHELNPTPFESVMYYDATISEDGAISFHGNFICEKDGDPYFWAKGKNDTRVLMLPSFKNPHAPLIDLFNFGDSVKDYALNITRMIEFALDGDLFSQKWLMDYVDKFEDVETPLGAMDIFGGLTLQQKLHLCFQMMKRN